MPELPEVETIACGLRNEIVGRTIVSAEVNYAGATRGPAEEFISRVEGRGIRRVWRRGKFLGVDLDGDMHLGVHLKMSGRFWVPPEGHKADKHTHIVLRLDNGRELHFRDVRKFGYCMALTGPELRDLEFLRTLGPEPLEIPPGAFVELFKSRHAAIKSLLLNQKVIAGIGNIYADESLFRAKIRPDAKASRISRKKLAELHGHVQDVLRQAIAENGSSISDYRNAQGDAGGFQNRFNVYGKQGEPCPCCGTPFSSAKVAGRTSTFCRKCQK